MDHPHRDGNAPARRIERVLAWAKGRGLRDGENPARWNGHLDEMLAAPSKVRRVKHHSALPYQEARPSWLSCAAATA